MNLTFCTTDQFTGKMPLARKPIKPPTKELLCQFEVIGQAPELHPTKRQYRNPANTPAIVSPIFNQFFRIHFFTSKYLYYLIGLVNPEGLSVAKLTMIIFSYPFVIRMKILSWTFH